MNAIRDRATAQDVVQETLPTDIAEAADTFGVPPGTIKSHTADSSRLPRAASAS
jgi:DNA-directed RNA polymerase specialized sigma24 family protein